MDYQEFTDSVAMACCILSVEQKNGGPGMIRIVCANEAYKTIMGSNYYDGMPYYELVPQDNKFEDFCYRSAILGQRMHAYVETPALGTWTDQTLIPLTHEKADIGCCQFLFEFTKEAEADRMSALSIENSARFIKACITLMNPGDFLDNVGKVLEDVLKESGAKDCRIMLIDHEKREAVNFCERSSPGAQEALGGPLVISYELIESWEDLIGVSNELILKDAPDFAWLEEKNPAWARSMRSCQVHSLVLIPLRRSGVVTGYLYVVNFDVSRVVEVKELLELLSYVLSSEISNQRLLLKLDEMSHRDGLTNLCNRNAMIRRIHEIENHPVGTIGVLNLDVNGLKRVNDEQGHEAGDRLLVQASEMLRKFFYEEDIFRTGGDEFVVIIRDISEETFLKKVYRLRMATGKKNPVCFAVGSCWTDAPEQLREVLHCADERMYADKASFYQRNPLLRRH